MGVSQVLLWACVLTLRTWNYLILPECLCWWEKLGPCKEGQLSVEPSLEEASFHAAP